MTITQQVIMVAAGAVATMLTRFIPFLVFRPGKPTPKYIMYLGKVLPASVFALLVVYCLRHVIYVHKDVVGDLHFPSFALYRVVSRKFRPTTFSDEHFTP